MSNTDNVIATRGTAERSISWDSLGISNRFIFYKVMRDNPDIALKLLQLTLPELGIESIDFIEPEKSIEETLDSRGVRLDAFAGDRKRVYDIEMQAENRDHLPKRTRYNQAMIDEELLDKGATFSTLKDSYVIFICPFDLFGKGRYRYTFRNYCDEDKELELEDGAVKIFLNADSEDDRIDPELRGFLNLVKGLSAESDFAKDIEKAVKLTKMDKEARHQYMTVDMWIREEAEIAKNEGLKEGRQEGLTDLSHAIRELKDGKTEEDLILSGVPEIAVKEARDILNTIMV